MISNFLASSLTTMKTNLPWKDKKIFDVGKNQRPSYIFLPVRLYRSLTIPKSCPFGMLRIVLSVATNNAVIRGNKKGFLRWKLG